MKVRVEHRKDKTIHVQVNGREIEMPKKGQDLIIEPKPNNDNYTTRREENTSESTT